MADIDIEKLAYQAVLEICKARDWDESSAVFIKRDTHEFRKTIAALVLEEAARRCDDDDGCGYVPYHVPLVNMAEELRTIAEGLKR